MIKEFIKFIRGIDPEIEPVEAAEILWLAARTQKISFSKSAEKAAASPDEKKHEDKKKSGRAKDDPQKPGSETPSVPLYPYPDGSGSGRPSCGGRGKGYPVSGPGVPALPGRLELVRAFRPLKRNVSSRRYMELDIQATARRMAETMIRWPVIRPAKERWLELFMMVEDSPSILIWRPVIRELIRLMQGAGLFNNVTVRTVKFSDLKSACPGTGISPDRRLILVISDCVSHAWKNGTAGAVLQRWNRIAMTAIVQMLPEHIWPRTELARTEKARLRFPRPGRPNMKITVIRAFAGFRRKARVPRQALHFKGFAVVPVFPLDSAYIHDWACALAGASRFAPVGVMVPINGGEEKRMSLKADRSRPSADIQVRRFLATASPFARRLAGLLAAVPLVFPVMRLVQQTALPDSRHHHLAEVMLSGLIYRKTPYNADVKDDAIHYDFIKGAREPLLTVNRISETLNALTIANEKLRVFVDERASRAIDFRALVGSPEIAGIKPVGNDDWDFTRISIEVLRRLGGKYRKIGDHFSDIASSSGKGGGGHGPRPGDLITIRLGETGPEMSFAWIPPGEFMMGSPKDEPERDNDEKLHKVILTRGFYMQTTPVTQGQWKAVMGNNPSRFKDCGDDCPVERVSWDDARRFIKKLSRMTGEEYRLPTEAQWEYACRAGTTTPFNTGKCLCADTQANYDGNYPLKGCPKGKYRRRTTPVKKFPANAWGLYDMHGNVWEWCQDWYEDYPDGTVKDPVGPKNGRGRVGRGGGWDGGAGFLRSAARGRYSPGGRDGVLGFRLLREL